MEKKHKKERERGSREEKTAFWEEKVLFYFGGKETCCEDQMTANIGRD